MNPGITVILLIVTSTLSCDNKFVEPETSREEMSLLQTHQAWSLAIKEGDIGVIISYWDENAVQYFPGEPAIYGIKAIKKLTKQNRGTNNVMLLPEAEEVHVAQSGEMGYTIGPIAVKSVDKAGNSVSYMGNFICIWQKTSGVWKCVRFMGTFEN